eukprot:TRINITY_DN246_c0_g1_i9.p1 TRINITY_DN246_c0_g1~~TRINITY_DN246_c0_g1_i9.p1  ORF type:complete len:502 (-),score=77.63 TRINITY_DN246_c0_g1_i9:296-1801(-)
MQHQGPYRCYQKGADTDADDLGTPSCEYVAGNLASLSNPYYFVLYTLVALVFAPFVAGLYLFYNHEFQLWALQRPEHCLSKLLLPILATLDSLLLEASFHDFKLQRRFGDHFVAAGEVWLSSFADVSDAILSPQVRTSQLGEHSLQPRNMPAKDRCVFLLSLSDKAAGGNGYHEAFRKAVLQYVLDADAWESRQSDKTAEALIEELENDYVSMNSDIGGDFYMSSDRGLMSFFTGYLHYVLFGIDPNDADMQEPLRNFFVGQVPLLHYLQPFGIFLNKSSSIERVCEVYSKSPAFEAFKENVPAHANITKEELCLLMVSIMRIAGVQGCTELLKTLLGGKACIDFAKVDETGKSHTRRFLSEWDKLDLDNEEAIKRHILEVSRLQPPVVASHRVASEPFKCNIGGKECGFPKGTKIAIPFRLASADKAHWGDDAWEYDSKRSQLLESSVVYNSVGPRSNGRSCPGDKISMSTAIRLMQRLGRLRRSVTCDTNKAPATHAEA